MQKSMVQWNEIHPYSAAHVVQIGAALDAARLRDCIHTTLATQGLTCLRFDPERFTFQYEPSAERCEFRIIRSQQEPFSALVAEMERQLNLAFAWREPFSPFRFFAVPADDLFFLGLVYFHPAGDAESVVLLLRDIVTVFLDEGPATGPLDLYPECRSDLLLRQPAVLARKLLSLPAQVRNLRQSQRPAHADADDTTNGFAAFSLRPEQLGALVDEAKSCGVTVNDLFIALLLRSLSTHAAARERAGRRRKISIGCIVNIRKDLGLDGLRGFCVFLGSFTVTHEVPPGLGLRELSVDIRQQTSLVKRHKLYLGTALEAGFARCMLKFFSPARRKKFYAKYYPLWGGITNMNLNSSWRQRDSSRVQDYFRGVSTGPITPLVLSVTTIGERVNLGLSYRTAVFSRSDIEQLQRRFREQVEQIQTAA